MNKNAGEVLRFEKTFRFSVTTSINSMRNVIDRYVKGIYNSLLAKLKKEQPEEITETLI